MVCGCLNCQDLCDQCKVSVDQARLIAAVKVAIEKLETFRPYSDPAVILMDVCETLEGKRDG